MKLPRLDSKFVSHYDALPSIRWEDRDTDCTLVMASPHAEPDLWREYLAGARANYRKFGVEGALELEKTRTGVDTAAFFTAVDASGRVVAGVRAKALLHSAEESHAVVEWRGQPGLQAVRKMINDRLPFGVLEIKAAWVGGAREHHGALAAALARSPFWAMAALDAQFAMATAASYVLDRWRSSGGVVASIPATPYPDERYQTKMMWWDGLVYTEHAEPQQLSRILRETMTIRRMTGADERTVAVGAGL